LVYSVTDYESFDALQFWANELEQNAELNCIKFVVGTKIDIDDPDEEEVVSK